MTTHPAPYADRAEAGRALADRLGGYATRRDVIVLALPRGGVVVAVPVAEAVHAPLDILIVRKLGLPGQPELAMGAIAGVGADVEIVYHQPVLKMASVSEQDIQRVYRRELEELRRRERTYRQGRPAIPVRNQIVILVDDGVATGSTARAAIAALRHQEPVRVVLAVPVGSTDACAALEREADEVVCLEKPSPFYGVGRGYRDFRPVADAEVQSAMAQAARSTGHRTTDADADADAKITRRDGYGENRSMPF